MAQKVRFGIIGAGNFARRRHIPNLLAIPDVEILTVCNRTPATVQQVAQEFNIPCAVTDWREVLAQKDIDAVLIGTPPYFHHEATLAALAAGKHVLCEGRMTTSLDHAREMEAKARATGLKTLVGRTGLGVRIERFVQHLLDDGYVGNVRQVFGHWLVPSYVNAAAPIDWRQDPQIGGLINPLFLSGMWEVFRPWFGDAARVLAQSKTFTPQRLSSSGDMVPVQIPDAITVIAEMESGAVVTCLQTGVAMFGQSRVEIYGDKGTLIIGLGDDTIRGAQVGASGLQELPLPQELEGSWQVEADFVRLVRGEVPSVYPTFYDGMKYSEFTAAALISAKEGRWVALPLPE